MVLFSSDSVHHNQVSRLFFSGYQQQLNSIGAFALGFVNQGASPPVSHILIKADKPSGFVVYDQDSSNGRHFPNILELVDYYRRFLIHSYWNELPFER